MTLSNGLMGDVSDFVAAKLGLNFPPHRWNDLERALRPLARETGFDRFEPYARWLLSTPLNPRQLDQIVGKLTVGETYFFREPQAFAALRDYAVPQLVAARRGRSKPQLRAWSAGCCTGEEAYSLAIFLR
jgi:chemotaxis protein methyltransferase CheR